MDAEQDSGPSSGTAARTRNITLHLTVPENGTTGMWVTRDGTDDVEGVTPDSAAAAAGLKVGDRIREVNGKSPAVERKGLIGLLRAAVRPGKKITRKTITMNSKALHRIIEIDLLIDLQRTACCGQVAPSKLSMMMPAC